MIGKDAFKTNLSDDDNKDFILENYLENLYENNNKFNFNMNVKNIFRLAPGLICRVITLL